MRKDVWALRSSVAAITVIVLIAFTVGIYYYPQMPDDMASHWNAQGEVDGYMPRFWALFLVPLITVGLTLLFILIPKIDPLRANIEKFRRYYDRFTVIIVGFLFYMYLLTVLWNMGMRFCMLQLLAPAFGILFYYTGVLAENAERNWFIGIRTPWTLSSEEVWEKTHRIGGKLFKITGITAFLGVFFPSYSILLILIPVILASAYTVVYSYFEYQKQVTQQ